MTISTLSQTPNGFKKNRVKDSYLTLTNLNLYDVTLNFEHRFINKKWFNLGYLGDIGIGSYTMARVDYFTENEIPFLDASNEPYKTTGLFYPVSVNLFAAINLHFTSLYASVGYRKNIETVVISSPYDGPTYQLGIRIFFKKIYSSIIRGNKQPEFDN